MPERDPIDILRDRVAMGNWQELLKGDASLPGERKLNRKLFNIASPRTESVIDTLQTQTLLIRITQIRTWLLENGQLGTEHPDYQYWINEEMDTPEVIADMAFLQKPPYEAYAYRNAHDQDESFTILHEALELTAEDNSKDTRIVAKFGHVGYYELRVDFHESRRRETSPTQSPEPSPFLKSLAELGVGTEEEWVKTKKEVKQLVEDAIAADRLSRDYQQVLEDSYYSAVRPLAEMTDYEYAVVMKYFDMFIKDNQIPALPS